MFDFPSSPALGQTYTPTVGGPAYVWDGTAWKLSSGGLSGSVFIGDAPPANPQHGQLWWESDSGNTFIYYQDGSSGQWVQFNIQGGSTRFAMPRNRIVNPAIQISQEVAFGTAVTTSGTYFADQWADSFSGVTGANVAFYALSSAVPAAQPHGLMDIVAGTPFTTPATNNYASITQSIEGRRITDFNWGNASAIPAVLAFEAAINPVGAAGIYAVALRSSNADRSIAFPINLAGVPANVWTKFAFPVPPITTGTFARDNTKALEIWFSVMIGPTWAAPAAGVWHSANYIGLSGQSNLLAVTGHTFFIRKIGLYADPENTGMAPPFETPDEQQELLTCQRYWQSVYVPSLYHGLVANVTNLYSPVLYPLMRTNPAITGGSLTGSVYDSAGAVSNPTVFNTANTINGAFNIQATRPSGMTGIVARGFQLSARM